MAKTRKAHKPWKEYPLRTCRWLNECAICKEPIKSGERYYDGGFNLRAHETCVKTGEYHQNKYKEEKEKANE